MTAVNRKVPDIDTLLTHRAAGLTDKEIAALYDADRSRVSTTFRDNGHGIGSGAHNRRIHDDMAQLAEEFYREGGAVVAARYGVTPGGISNALRRARERGEVLPREARVRVQPTPREPKPKAAVAPRVKAVRKPKPAPKPKPVPVTPGYVEPDLRGKCAARELLGSRVCDRDPHTDRRHNGAGPKDARADFYGAR